MSLLLLYQTSGAVDPSITIITIPVIGSVMQNYMGNCGCPQCGSVTTCCCPTDVPRSIAGERAATTTMPSLSGWTMIYKADLSTHNPLFPAEPGWYAEVNFSDCPLSPTVSMYLRCKTVSVGPPTVCTWLYGFSWLNGVDPLYTTEATVTIFSCIPTQLWVFNVLSSGPICGDPGITVTWTINLTGG